MSVNLEWVAHACFRVWRDGGPVIVMDPYTPEVLGFEGDQTIEGDTVIVSSLTDEAHGFPKLVRGNPRVINALDLVQPGTEAQVDGSPIIAVGASESADRPEEFGTVKDNALYGLKVGDLWVVHLGDLGYGLTTDELAPFVGRCDLLLALVGQTLTIPLEDLDSLIDHLNPKWIVPMHYALAPLLEDMRPLSEFVTRRARDPVIYSRSSRVKFPLQISGPQRPTIVVLDPCGYQQTEIQPSWTDGRSV